MYLITFLRKLVYYAETNLFLKIFLFIISMWFVLRASSDNDKINYIKLNDDVNLKTLIGNDNENVFTYNKNTPIIFIGGVARSGAGLMHAILDAHPLIHCGNEIGSLSRLLEIPKFWFGMKKRQNRLKNAGITEDILNSAVSSFLLEIIVKQSKPAPNICNKDPLVLSESNYITKLFPNAKFILMIRDARATVHSIIAHNRTQFGFNLNSYTDSLRQWNRETDYIFLRCIALGSDVCLPVYYEQLVLQPEPELRKIFHFLKIEWNDAVLNHANYIDSEISDSQFLKPINSESLTAWFGQIPDDVLDNIDSLAPTLRILGYDTKSKKPNYNSADAKLIVKD